MAFAARAESSGSDKENSIAITRDLSTPNAVSRS
jgi:hypothetical protein